MMKKIILLIFIITMALFHISCKNDVGISEMLNRERSGFNGYVFFKSQGEEVPILGAEVILSTNTFSTSVFTDKNGYFQFDKNVLDNRKYILKISTDYFSDYIEEIDFSDESNGFETDKYYIQQRDFDFNNSAYIGKIVVNNKPVKNLPVRIGVVETTTDENGFFVFNNLKRGNYLIQTMKSDFVNVSRRINIEKNYIHLNNILELSRQTINLSGKVLNKSTSEVLENVEIEVSLNNEYYYFNERIYTDSEGEFTLENLIEGEYIFTFEKEGYYIKSLRLNISSERERNQLNGVQMEEGDSKLIMVVKDKASDKPVSGIELEVEGYSGSYISDSSGVFTVYGLAKGSYNMKLSSDLYNDMEHSINISEDVHNKEIYMVSKVNIAQLRGKIFLEDGSNLVRLPISSSEKELDNFELMIRTEDYTKIVPHTPTRGQLSNEYVYDNLPSGNYDFLPLVVVDEDLKNNLEPSDLISGGIYGLDESSRIKINTGEEIEYDIILKKQGF
ncbi:MAG: hypothetical protein ACQESP_09685 [Candidatus Muiribacteriota bacterium]